MPFATGKPLRDVLGLLGVIEHQEPWARTLQFGRQGAPSGPGLADRRAAKLVG
jgi:hypothetical protein